MSPSNNNRNSGRQPETPQRVANAAEQMRMWVHAPAIERMDAMIKHKDVF